MTRMLLVRPRYDIATSYTSAWAEPLKREAERRGWLVSDISGTEAVRKAVLSRLQKGRPALISLNGHGNAEAFFGHESQLALGRGDASLFTGAIAFARACECVVGLGKSAAEGGCRAFIGYRRKFWIARSTDHGASPEKDGIARPVFEASNAVPFSLLKGHT